MRYLCIILCLSVISGNLYAEKIYLKNGKVLEGRITKHNIDYFILETGDSWKKIKYDELENSNDVGESIEKPKPKPQRFIRYSVSSSRMYMGLLLLLGGGIAITQGQTFDNQAKDELSKAEFYSSTALFWNNEAGSDYAYYYNTGTYLYYTFYIYDLKNVNSYTSLSNKSYSDYGKAKNDAGLYNGIGYMSVAVGLYCIISYLGSENTQSYDKVEIQTNPSMIIAKYKYRF